MNTKSPTTNAAGAQPAETRPDGTPVGRVVAASLTAGGVAALLLVLVVVPGAPEHVITGSLLLAFGFGWAMLAVLTSRLTSRPQRWSTVPAAVMGTMCLALLVFAPRDAALTVLNWVWPPVMLALVAWSAVKMLAALKGRGRWFIAPVLAVLAAASIGAVTSNIADTNARQSYPATGKLVSVGDHQLHLDCRGQGSPTVVLFNGLGEFSGSWARVTDQLAGTTRVCAYDRAGQGWSEDATSVQDGVTAAEELQLLLAQAGEQGPYVLAGHSIGGTYAMSFAAKYPEQVSGMVLLDSSSPQQMTAIPSYPGQYAAMLRGLAMGPTLARIGLGPLFSSGSHLPAPAADGVQALTSTARAARNARDVIAMIPEVFQQAQALTTLNGAPLAVLTASESSLGIAGWDAAQDKLAALSFNCMHRDVESTHAGLIEEVHGAEESSHAITDVVTAVRTGTPLSAR
ncbi:alpha/beta fold hydrolase [Arthrobacter sp. LjRoot14]|uniref:alpha/beta fold hydrolase n=1 Tax=Arthrobacter sp. LjRoot14 TaxID=3342265 RepID=UPI003ECF9022